MKMPELFFMENTQKNYGEMCNVTKIKLELETRYTMV